MKTASDRAPPVSTIISSSPSITIDCNASSTAKKTNNLVFWPEPSSARRQLSASFALIGKFLSRTDGIDDHTQNGIELGQRRRGCHMRMRLRVAHHRCKVLAAPPLGVVDDLGSVKAPMNAGGNETGQMLHGFFRS